MDIEEYRIREFDDLIQQCIDGNIDSLKLLDSTSVKLTFGEIENAIAHFRVKKKYHHVHYFLCEMYSRFDRNFAVKLFVENGEFFSPSYYWAGRHYYAESEYRTSKNIFEKGYEKKHWFCGMYLSNMYLHGDISSIIKGIKLKLILAYAAFFVDSIEYSERYIRSRFREQ